jgi:phosphoglycolate phosphatase
VSRPGIVFDLDGTLVDSLPDILASFVWAFGHLGLEPPPAQAVRAEIGLPLEAMYACFAPAGAVPALAAAYRRHYPERFTEHTRPFPGVPELLAELRARGYALAVATTKQSPMAWRLVEAVGLAAALDHVQGTDGFAHKPAPDVVERALATLGARGEWMVGDTIHDVAAGRAAGLRTYAVTWGTHDAQTLRNAEPDVLADDLQALVPALVSGAAARSGRIDR